jgi:hypothetical protein
LLSVPQSDLQLVLYRCCYAARCCCRRRDPALADAVGKFARTLSGSNTAAAAAAAAAAANNHPGIHRRDDRLTSSARRAYHGSARSNSRQDADRFRRRHSLSDMTDVSVSDVNHCDVKAACVIDLNALAPQRQAMTAPLIDNNQLVAEAVAGDYSTGAHSAVAAALESLKEAVE